MTRCPLGSMPTISEKPPPHPGIRRELRVERVPDDRLPAVLVPADHHRGMHHRGYEGVGQRRGLRLIVAGGHYHGASPWNPFSLPMCFLKQGSAPEALLVDTNEQKADGARTQLKSPHVPLRYSPQKPLLEEYT